MKSGVLWDEVAQIAAKDYPDVEFHHILADNAAMSLTTHATWQNAGANIGLVMM